MDHYQTLGIEKSATAEQIKAAYRRLARKYHPDVSKEAEAQEKIKAVNEAYAVLGDAEKRRAYDRRGRSPAAEQFGGENDFFAGGLHDLFDTLFSRGGRGAPLYALHLTMEQAYRGGKRTLSVNGEQMQVDIPPGVGEGDRVATQDGAWQFQVHYAPHDKFKVQDGHVLGTVLLYPWDLALGGKHPVETLGGTVQATLPDGLQPGQRIRLAGRGMPGTPYRNAGDHWAQVVVQVPKASTSAQKKAYQALRDSFGKK